ncbi:hypothetical protein O4J55_28605, partial [Paracoccus sp. PXZ]
AMCLEIGRVDHDRLVFGALGGQADRGGVAAEKDLVDSVAVGFDLAQNFCREGAFPERFLFAEECLEAG